MDTSHNEPDVALPGKRGWRRHSKEFKSRVIALAREPNTSVAAVALANGLNANMLRRWVREAESAAVDRSAAPAAPVMPAFVPLTVPPVSGSPPRVPSAPCTVAFEIRRGGISVHASLPLDARSAAWLRDVLG